MTGSQSTEGADRPTLALDGEAMIQEASKLNHNIIRAAGAALTGWRESVQAIVTTARGQELAHALVTSFLGT